MLAAVGVMAAATRTAGAQTDPGGAADTVVTLEGLGDVRGSARNAGGHESGHRAFLGVPFAKVPRRWQNPQPPESWSDVLDATKGKPMCPQPSIDVMGGWTMTPNNMTLDEDCLFLNVYAPREDDLNGVKVPVLVFIHGGAYLIGGASDPRFDGGALVEHVVQNHSKPIVVFVIAYRLGPFGFLFSPELQADNADGSAGNFAIADQRQALLFVQKHAHVFGGDKEQVTIAGQSSGAFSVLRHVSSPLSKGLFIRAIAMSGHIGHISHQDRLPEEAVRVADELQRFAGCGDSPAKGLACLRAKTAREILEATGKMCHDTTSTVPKPMCQVGMDSVRFGTAFAPVPDGVETQVIPAVAANRGAVLSTGAVPLLIGHTRDESALYALLSLGGPAAMMSEENVTHAALEATFGETVAERIRALYPPSKPEGAGPSPAVFQYMKAMSDAFVRCPVLRGASWLAASGKDVFVYRFDGVNPYSGSALGLGFLHADDLPYFFQQEPTPKLLKTDREKELAHHWTTTVLEFMHSGQPAPGASWPKLDASTKGSAARFMAVGTTSGDAMSVLSEPSPEDVARCDFWSDEVGTLDPKLAPLGPWSVRARPSLRDLFDLHDEMHHGEDDHGSEGAAGAPPTTAATTGAPPGPPRYRDRVGAGAWAGFVISWFLFAGLGAGAGIVLAPHIRRHSLSYGGLGVEMAESGNNSPQWSTANPVAVAL